MLKTRRQRRARQRHITKGLQSTLPGQEEPNPCIHPISSYYLGRGVRSRPSLGPCDACLWCFRDEAWESRPCYRPSICPLKEKKRIATYGKEFEPWLVRSRSKVMLNRLTGQIPKSRSTDSEASQTLPAE